ncbi:MAG TPA: aldo/keto reductase [Terriglobales bacterium]|nr:aldo/keto reductase [Terriglobales bacterium]
MSWSPLASGFLTGKYRRLSNSGTGEGRLAALKDNPVFNRFHERNWQVLDVLLDVSRQIGRPPAQVALNWVGTQPGVTSTIIGATKLPQLEDNLAALQFAIPPELRGRLNEASAIDLVHPYKFFTGAIHDNITGGALIKPWQPAQVQQEPLRDTAKADAAD